MDTKGDEDIKRASEDHGSKNVKELVRRAEKAETRAEGLQAQVSALREQLERLEAEVDSLETQCDELERTGGEKAQTQIARLEKEKEELEGYLDQLARYAFALRDLTARILKHDRAYGAGTGKLIKSRKWWRRIAIVALVALTVVSYGRFAAFGRVVDQAVAQGKHYVTEIYNKIRHQGD